MANFHLLYWYPLFSLSICSAHLNLMSLTSAALFLPAPRYCLPAYDVKAVERNIGSERLSEKKDFLTSVIRDHFSWLSAALFLGNLTVKNTALVRSVFSCWESDFYYKGHPWLNVQIVLNVKRKIVYPQSSVAVLTSLSMAGSPVEKEL